MNPLAEYVVKLAKSIDGVSPPDETMKGAKWAVENVLEELIALLPALENLITWTDGPPTEDGEYLVSWSTPVKGVHCAWGWLYRGYFSVQSLPQHGAVETKIPLTNIRRHARLKVG